MPTERRNEESEHHRKTIVKLGKQHNRKTNTDYKQLSKNNHIKLTFEAEKQIKVDPTHCDRNKTSAVAVKRVRRLFYDIVNHIARPLNYECELPYSHGTQFESFLFRLFFPFENFSRN